MLNILFTFLPGFFALLFCSLTHAEEFRLNFNDSIFGGFQTVDLHLELYEQYQVDSRELNIDHVEVVLKSQYGGGLTWTGSPYNQSDRRLVTGQEANFNNPAGWNFNRIVFPATGSADDLLLNLNGQFKLREVFVRTRD